MSSWIIKCSFFAICHPIYMITALPSILNNLPLFLKFLRTGGMLDWKTCLLLKDAVLKNNNPNPNIVEVGAYKGLSTVFLAYACSKTNKRVKSFEWFKGLPEPNPTLDSAFYEGSFISTQDVYERNLQNSGLRKWVDLTVGDARVTMIPAIKQDGFSIAFIDIDLYEVTRQILKQLRSVIRGGELIIIHDYDSPGIKKAVDEFTNTFNENIKTSVFRYKHHTITIELNTNL